MGAVSQDQPRFFLRNTLRGQFLKPGFRLQRELLFQVGCPCIEPKEASLFLQAVLAGDISPHHPTHTTGVIGGLGQPLGWPSLLEKYSNVKTRLEGGYLPILFTPVSVILKLARTRVKRKPIHPVEHFSSSIALGKL